ncbi:MAG: phosphatidylserine decarboxylase [Proteobacteria bacterium]|nr:phosphatidylserine decarboxylase [Pseudomonadota bacterium]
MRFLESIVVPINRAGLPFVAAFAAVSLLLGAFVAPLGWLGALLTAWCAYFFRDPDRVTPGRPGLMVSPADGVVQAVREAVPPSELEMGEAARIRISIFMNVFDVHVNRVPIAGTVVKIAYQPGRFFNATLDKASEFNERNSIRLLTDDDREVAVVQIAGLIARRIVCTLAEGQEAKTGERLGIIRFGSRVDVYLPAGVNPLVSVGQRMLAGETVIADLVSAEPARHGEIR